MVNLVVEILGVLSIMFDLISFIIIATITTTISIR